jgi:hypothetical protein
LRRDLLSGKPDIVCRGCGLRGVTTPNALQEKVRILQLGLATPREFDPVAYLDANPDLKHAKAEPAGHFLNWGRLEGRPLTIADRRAMGRPED